MLSKETISPLPILSAQTIPLLLDRFAQHLSTHPKRNACFTVGVKKGQLLDHPVTYETLASNVWRYARYMESFGLRPGDRIILSLDDSEVFLTSMLAAMSAGFVSVPLPTFSEFGVPTAFLDRIRVVAADCRPQMIIVGNKVLWKKYMNGRSLPIPVIDIKDLHQLSTQEAPEKITLRQISESEPAFIQYTSGSTGNPKGVIITQRNLAANLQAIGMANQCNSDSDVLLSWLPLHHDMGLVGGLLFAIYWRIPTYLLSPIAFISRPVTWLWAIHRFRATYSVAPNFAYGIAFRKIPDWELTGLDLSSWRLAFIGAEPIDAETARGFTKRFVKYGLNPDAFYPVYGMAEATLAISFPNCGDPAVFDCVDRELLSLQGRAIPTDPLSPKGVSFVSVGKALPGHSVWIENPETGERVPERHAGEIVFKGPSVSPGYFSLNNFNTTPREVLRTGDLGYEANGNLFIIDRIKDLIIIAGQNFVPSDIENCLSRIPGLRLGRIVAFSVPNGEGTEALHIVAEINPRVWRQQEAIKKEIISAVNEYFGVKAEQVLLVGPGSLPKTSSGKIRRKACRELYSQGKFQNALDFAARMRLRKRLFSRWLVSVPEKALSHKWFALRQISEPFLRLFIPESFFTADADTLRRAKLVVAFSFALAVWSPVFATVYYSALHSTEGAIGIALAGLFAITIPFLLRKTGRITLLGNLLTLDLFAILSFAAYISGGHGSPPLMWKVAVPMVAICMAGIRSGFFWMGMALLEIAGFYCFDQLGLRPPYVLHTDQMKFLQVTVLSGLLLLIMSLTYIYEMIKRQTLETIEDNNRKIAEGHARTKAIVDNATDGIITLDERGAIESVNQAAEHIFAYSSAELKGKFFTVLLNRLNSEPVSSQATSPVARELLERNVGKVHPAAGLRKSGEMFPLEMGISEARVGTWRMFTLLTQDVTDRKKKEEELRRAKDAAEAASKAKSTFLANMSHELRTPMHAIISYSNFGKKEAPKAEKEILGNYFSQILTSSHRLLNLLNDLLELSKLEANSLKYSFKVNDLSRYIQQVLSEFKGFAEEKKLVLEYAPDGASTRAVCDAEKIGQVLRNLVSNAIKFSKPGTTVVLRVNSATLTSGTNGNQVVAPALAVSVINQGVGIPENELELIFDKFVQSSKTRSGSGGTGLGLAICKEIINGHQGKIFAHNEPEGKTRFTFMIPIGRVA